MDWQPMSTYDNVNRPTVLILWEGAQPSESRVWLARLADNGFFSSVPGDQECYREAVAWCPIPPLNEPSPLPKGP